jgi:membrane-bound metal-dependent hydrolase YbcI (DUF457 family)
MHRRGHVGITLLAFAPIAYFFLRNDSFMLAILGWIGVQAIEPLPDNDFWIPRLRHRGVSHSLVAALIVGIVLGTVGWLLSGSLVDVSVAAMTVLSTSINFVSSLYGDILGRLPVTIAQTAGVQPAHPPTKSVSAARVAWARGIDRQSVALFGFLVGIYGIIVHLLGDIITFQGIKPFHPISQRRVSLSPLRADNSTANAGLFALGVLAMGLAVVFAVPNIEVVLS